MKRLAEHNSLLSISLDHTYIGYTSLPSSEPSRTATSTSIIMSSKYNKLAGKNVLVIGGSSGIGYGVAAAALEASLPAGSGGGRIAAIRADLSRADTIEADLEAVFAAAPAPTDHIAFTA